LFQIPSGYEEEASNAVNPPLEHIFIPSVPNSEGHEEDYNVYNFLPSQTFSSDQLFCQIPEGIKEKDRDIVQTSS